MEKKHIDYYKMLLRVQNDLSAWLDQADDDHTSRDYFCGQCTAVEWVIDRFEYCFPEIAAEVWKDLKSPDQSPK